MVPWAPGLLALLHSEREYLVDALQRGSDANPVPPPFVPRRRDLEQLVDGFIGVVTEALEGRPPVKRGVYFDTVTPGLVESGREFGGLVHTTAIWAFLALEHLAPRLPPEGREEALEWLRVFLGGWLADLARSGAKASAR
jgi:hypothetical protein